MTLPIALQSSRAKRKHRPQATATRVTPGHANVPLVVTFLAEQQTIFQRLFALHCYHLPAGV
jgi:hypothetical protein